MYEKDLSNKTESKGNMAHDKGYKDVFSNKDSFIHFLNKYINASWAKDIIADDLERINTSYVMEDYKERDSDIIYKFKNNGEDVYFYVLLELQSSPNFTMPFRLLQYMVNLLANDFKNTPENVRETKNFRLPAIVPIILYNGEDKWTPVRSFKEYTANYGNFGDNIINFKYILFDLNRFNQEDILTTHKLLDFIFTIDLKHYSRKASDFRNEFQKLAGLQHELTDDDINTFISWFFHVILKGDADENFIKEAAKDFRKGVAGKMTYAFDRLLEREKKNSKLEGIKEGMQKGMQKGIKEGRAEQSIATARKLLKRNRPIEEIMEDTDLTRDEIENLVLIQNQK